MQYQLSVNDEVFCQDETFLENYFWDFLLREKVLRFDAYAYAYAYAYDLFPVFDVRD